MNQSDGPLHNSESQLNPSWNAALDWLNTGEQLCQGICILYQNLVKSYRFFFFVSESLFFPNQRHSGEDCSLCENAPPGGIPLTMLNKRLTLWTPRIFVLTFTPQWALSSAHPIFHGPENVLLSPESRPDLGLAQWSLFFSFLFFFFFFLSGDAWMCDITD